MNDIMSIYESYTQLTTTSKKEEIDPLMFHPLGTKGGQQK